MTTEQDILAGRVNAALEEWDATPAGQGAVHVATHVAATLIAAGYRKPRTIENLAELAALPAESAVQTSDPSDTVVLKGDDGLFRNYGAGEVGVDDLWRYGAKPFTVIYEPQEGS